MPITAEQLSSIYKRCGVGLQVATLRVPSRPGGATTTFTDYQLSFVDRKPSTVSDEQTMAVVLASGKQAVTWTIWGDDLRANGAPNPREGDQILDPTRANAAGNPQRWVIVKADEHLLGEAFHCTCTRAD